MNSYPVRACFKPNQSYVCLSCLLGRPLAPSRRTFRYKSTDATGVYPTPDHSVAALLWSQEKSIAKVAKDSGTAETEAAQEGQTEPSNVVPPKPAGTAKAKRKVKRDGKGKGSKASGHQPKAVKPRTTAGKSETIVPVPKPTTITKGPPVRNPPTSLKDSLRKTISQVAKASLLDVAKVLSNKDGHLEQTQDSERERTTGPDETVTSGPKKVGSAVKAAKRPKKASSGKSDKLAEHKKEGLAKAPAHGSGSVEESVIKKYKSDKGNAKPSKAKAAISSHIEKKPSGGLIRKLGSDGGIVARKLRSTLDLNAVIKKTEAALERRDQEVRLEAKKERLSQARRRSQGAPAGERSGTKHVKVSKMDGAVSKKEALTQESGGDVKAMIGTEIQTVNAAELDIARTLKVWPSRTHPLTHLKPFRLSKLLYQAYLTASSGCFSSELSNLSLCFADDDGDDAAKIPTVLVSTTCKIPDQESSISILIFRPSCLYLSLISTRSKSTSLPRGTNPSKSLRSHTVKDTSAHPPV